MGTLVLVLTSEVVKGDDFAEFGCVVVDFISASSSRVVLLGGIVGSMAITAGAGKGNCVGAVSLVAILDVFATTTAGGGLLAMAELLKGCSELGILSSSLLLLEQGGENVSSTELPYSAAICSTIAIEDNLTGVVGSVAVEALVA